MTAQTTAHTPARINPDHLAVLIVATVLTAALAATSFMLSFAALEAVAEWAAVPPALTWAVPVFIDAAILVYTLAALVARAREESARAAWVSLALWTAVSVTANALHAWTDIPDEVRTGAGMTIAGLAPVALLLATHTLADLIVAKPDTTAASAAGPDGQADADTATDDAPDARTDGRPDSGRTDTAPVPLVVLEEIEQAAPRTDTAADSRADAGARHQDDRTDTGQPVDGRTAPDGQADIASVCAQQPALELVPAQPRTRAATPSGQADTGRTGTGRGRRPSVEALRPQIAELARQGMKGREIARHLGTGATRTCEIVREIKDADAVSA